MKKLKTVHIHTDHKFVGASRVFEGNLFENTLVIINNGKPYKGSYKGNIIEFKNIKQDIEQIVGLSNEADLVVVYGLDGIKAKLVTSISSDVKIAWRFFGFELYNRMKSKLHSELTKAEIAKKNLNYFLYQLKSPKSIIKKVIKRSKSKTTKDNDFQKAVGRITYFLGIFEEEYIDLKKNFSYLPHFIELPNSFFSTFNMDVSLKSKTNQVLIGNSPSPSNNHFDIIKLIEEVNIKEDLNFILPCSYGSPTHYSLNLKKKIKNQHIFKFLNDFLPLDEYRQLIANSNAAVYNTYRQMGMGNIFFSLLYGVKVYLNTKNPTYHWFKKIGLKIFTIEDFGNDLKTGKCCLTQEEYDNNLEVLSKLNKESSVELFQNKVIELLGS